MLTDYAGRRAVIAPSTIMSGASMLLFCLAPSYAWFIADLFGPTVSLVTAAGLMAVAGGAFAVWAPETYRGRDTPRTG